MVCSISCSISAVFIIGMIYFYNAADKSTTVKQYRQQLSTQQKAVYDKIAAERLKISMQGYGLGFLLSLFIIYYNYQKTHKLRSSVTVCIVLATSFLTNYFYYILSPKTDWMLNHIEGSEAQVKQQTQAWLQMYRTMQFYYHAGLVLGILGIGIFAYAFCRG